MVLEVSVSEKDCLETLALTYRQITMKTLEMVKQSSAIIHRQLFHSKRQHLVYYWALTKNEHWPPNCQAIWAAYIIIWVLSNPTLSHKLGCAQQQSIIKWKWYICDQTWAGPNNATKWQNEVVLMSMTSTSVKIISVLNHTPIASCSMPY